MEAAYRAELIRGCSAAADDRLFTQALSDVCGFALLESLRWWPSPFADQGSNAGVLPPPHAALARLEALVNTATEFDCLPFYRNVAGQLLTTLQQQWPATEPMPLYPAFR
ncbi:MAG: hypothetical protein R3E79_59355 [Caldilineaceae bacterium]